MFNCFVFSRLNLLWWNHYPKRHGKKEKEKEMNATELADWLIAYMVDDDDYEEKYMEQIVTMLRQQQAEIEALKDWQDTWRPFLRQHFGIEK